MVNQLAVQSSRLPDHFVLERVRCEPSIHYTHSRSIKLDLWPKFFWSVSSYKYLVSHELFNWQGVTEGIRNSRMISQWGDLELWFKRCRIPPKRQMQTTCASFRMIGGGKITFINLGANRIAIFTTLTVESPRLVIWHPKNPRSWSKYLCGAELKVIGVDWLVSSCVARFDFLI